jgi:hypothetical protein
VEGWVCCPVHAEVVVVDPVDRRVVARVPLAGGGFSASPTTDGIVALVEPKTGIKAVRVAAIDREGRSRSVTVSRIKAMTPNAVLVPSSGALSAYEFDGTLRYTVPLPAGNLYISVFGNYAYSWTTDTVTLVDLKSGSIVASLPRPALYVIGADS